MNTDLEKVLNSIGWAKARNHPYAGGWVLTLQPNGGLIASSPSDASAAKARLNNLWRAMQVFHEEVEALSPEARRSINLFSTPPDERDGGWPDHLANATAALRKLEEGVEIEAKGLESAAAAKANGAPKKEPAYRVAAVMAEIYFVGLGKMPGIGASTPFVRATGDALKILGIGLSYVPRICSSAKRRLTEERQVELLSAWTARPVSLFDLWGMQNP